MKKKTFMIAGLALLAAGLSAVALAGCSEGDYKFEEYSFNYGGASEKDWRALEYPDANITMDGVVNTGEYGESCLSFSDVNDVNMKVYAHMGEEGVFFGFVSNDRYVNYNPSNDVFNNTSVEIQVAADGTETLNSNVVQLRLGANGTPDQWVGFRADDMAYDYTKKYIPSMGVVHIDGTLNESAEGYSVELYLPYSSIGLAEKPERVVCAPSFNTMPDPLSSQRATWTMMLGCDLSQPATWYVVDETGMTAHTAGFEKKGDVIGQTKGYNEFYYFDTAPHGSYYLKTKLTVQTTTNPFFNDDQYPKFGLVNKAEHALQTFHVDAAQRTGTNFGTVHAEQTTNGGTNWMWDSNASTSMTGHWGNGYLERYRNKELETIYYGGDLYFVLDGVLVKTVKDFAPEEEGAVPGFMCFNTRATFESSEFETDPEKVKAEAEKFIAKDLTIDGDLSDWTDATVNTHGKYIEDSGNGNSMKARAFRGTDGLYIAYEVHHIVNIAPKKWDDGWWLNTNIEFFVNGNEEKDHYALTSFGNSGYMDGVMITTRNDEDRTFETVGEIFLPFTSLAKDGRDESTAFEIGFAFKTADGTSSDKLNGRDWWSFEGDPNSTFFPIGTKGIGAEYTLTYSKGTDEGVVGEVPAAVKVFEGDSVKLADNPFTRSGYRFIGWTDGEHVYDVNKDFVMPRGDVTLSPRWVSESAEGPYIVTYEKGAEEVAGQVPVDEREYYAGESVTVQAGDLVRDGYRFMGWNDGSALHQPNDTFLIEEEDVTLTAEWSKLYTVTYTLAEGEEGNVPAPAQYVEGETVQVSAETVTKDGFDFVGWTFKDKTYTPGGAFEMPAEDVTLAAKWSPKLTVDGLLTDWQEGGSKALEAHSYTDERRATWYGVIRDDGVYLAVEYYHNNDPKFGQEAWFNNTNFEIRFKDNTNPNHFFVYLKDEMGVSGLPTLGSDGQYNFSTSQAAYRNQKGSPQLSVFEVFYPNSIIEQYKEGGVIRIGLAVKTAGGDESINGGGVGYEGDAWYAPYGVWPDGPDMYAYLTRDGLYLKEEYEHPDWEFGVESAAEDDKSITLDGNISDWSGMHTLGIVGSDQYTGKSVTFYGKMTKAGLYLAADAYHDLFTTGQAEWWNNTNFELRIGRNWGGEGNKMPKQFWVYAKSFTEFGTSDDYMQVKGKTEQLDSGKYHTTVEVFLPAENFVEYDYMIRNGMIQVGVAWKTNDDKINNGTIEDDPWWLPAGTHVNSNPACVDGSGIYTAKDYEERE